VQVKPEVERHYMEGVKKSQRGLVIPCARAPRPTVRAGRPNWIQNCARLAIYFTSSSPQKRKRGLIL